MTKSRWVIFPMFWAFCAISPKLCCGFLHEIEIEQAMPYEPITMSLSGHAMPRASNNAAPGDTVFLNDYRAKRS